MIAIIGGSGLCQFTGLSDVRREIVRTPYGEASAPLVFGGLASAEVVFLSRHGCNHTIAPHRINYRANIWALARAAQAQRIVAIATVGGIRADRAPGTLCLPDQIIDYTYGRDNSFGDDQPHANGVRHIDFTVPYDEPLRSALLFAAQSIGQDLIAGGVYAATQGPRLETAAEIRRLARDGADIVGMTGMPEAALAREAGLPYAAICPVVNWAAGCADSASSIDFQQISTQLDASLDRVRALITSFCEDSRYRPTD